MRVGEPLHWFTDEPVHWLTGEPSDRFTSGPDSSDKNQNFSDVVLRTTTTGRPKSTDGVRVRETQKRAFKGDWGGGKPKRLRTACGGNDLLFFETFFRSGRRSPIVA